MNSDTGQIYRGNNDIFAAMGRNEPIIPVTSGFAEWMESQPESSKRKVARTLANIQRCQPHLTLTKAQNLARRTAVL